VGAVLAQKVFFRNPTQGVTVTQGYTQGCNTARRPEYKQFASRMQSVSASFAPP
jgi:hypothetical protein